MCIVVRKNDRRYLNNLRTENFLQNHTMDLFPSLEFSKMPCYSNDIYLWIGFNATRD